MYPIKRLSTYPFKSQSNQIKHFKNLNPSSSQFKSLQYHSINHSSSSSSSSKDKIKIDTKNVLPSDHDKPHQPTFVQAVIATYLPSIRSLAAKLPHLRNPPTPKDLLPLTNSFIDRAQIRFKWLTIRSFRPYRPDDYSAFASLIFILALILAALTTTSFLGVLLLIFNKAGLEDLVARWLSDYLSRTTGVRILFASALVPRWRDGLIRFENVIVLRGTLGDEPSGLFNQILQAHQIQSLDHEQTEDDHFSEVDKDLSHILRSHSKSSSSPSQSEHTLSTTSSNFTHFHLTIATIDVTLSLRRWLNGKGLIRQAAVSGVRGVVDRSHLESTQANHQNPTLLDRSSTRRKPSTGDFDLEQLLVDDLLVTIYQPNSFRPYTFSIFSAHVRRLRKQWLFLDLISAEQVTGQIDNCLFSLHRPQSLTHSNLSPTPRPSSSKYETHFSRFRIDGVPIDHLQSAGDEGPLSWITSGKVDLVADISLPRESEKLDLRSVVREIVDNIEKEIVQPQKRISERPELIKPALEAPLLTTGPTPRDDDDDDEVNDNHLGVVIEMDIRFKDVKATVPLFSHNLSHVNHALVRPIVAFINSNKTLIPIRCALTLPLTEFDGSWTAYDLCLVEKIGSQVYHALAFHVTNSNGRRVGIVGIWGVQLVARSILGALREHWKAAH
ncbi:mitochondrial distribution and morphology protein family 31/32 [Melampsora americana]|nr:mitochondrial distribution and morphology protein family 31/32 [Melampsora americana]